LITGFECFGVLKSNEKHLGVSLQVFHGFCLEKVRNFSKVLHRSNFNTSWRI
jgi:hypothetical protein